MKKKNLLAIFCALAMSAAIGMMAACVPSDDPGNTPGGDTPGGDTPGGDPQTVYGLPVAESGHYINNSDAFEEDGTRWLFYTTNETSGEEDNVIAVRKASFEEGADKGWAYGEETIALRGTEGGWDEYLGSASVVKGSFEYGGAEYGYLMAYCGTPQADETQFSIGLAVAQSPDGAWTKVGSQPVVAFDAANAGSAQTAVGNYAPSLVNYDKEGGVRLFYTFADSYGHFAKFVDIEASDLDAPVLSGEAVVPNHGEIAGGDTVAMFPNADFVYDASGKQFYAVKDYSPTPSQAPAFARRIQLLSIAEGELYTTDLGEGWKGIRTWDNTDTPDGMYERLYGACIVSDAYGHIDGAADAEIVYNICMLEADTDDYLFTQNLMSFEIALS
ncbi:MAG TPA: hypothetical protein H9797_04170 [Candidatus Gallimonas gallistercoris]|uniref:Uncharacterized protein n=1 Tax=Candidatus Gallimonas gallistercoris TaxID=2838602 RepID=A0A9D2H2X7_9FIRM|nr:hypothetical protein [Candidatus Gallimonas gallistercoris]